MIGRLIAMQPVPVDLDLHVRRMGVRRIELFEGNQKAIAQPDGSIIIIRDIKMTITQGWDKKRNRPTQVLLDFQALYPKCYHYLLICETDLRTFEALEALYMFGVIDDKRIVFQGHFYDENLINVLQHNTFDA